MSIREASDCFASPKSTLGDRIKALVEGRETVLKSCTANSGTFQIIFTDIHEVELYNHIKTLHSLLLPLNKTEFLKLAYQFAEKLKINHRFNKTTTMTTGFNKEQKNSRHYPTLALQTLPLEEDEEHREKFSLPRLTKHNWKKKDLI
ncbi:hypothetical protein PR048_005170 [Dryococelus australis]|uniref:Uncharacterized protein n=1 Tax=Dryococelus australis TaxID=614101 RepID=A0ABQ9I7G0_9NEOP|nr:hypothetical protein PR048_005170 [Dryococelus australis]